MKLREQLFLQQIRFSTLLAYHLRDWRKLPIVENGEQLSEVPATWAKPYYADVGHTADRRVFVRTQVLERLCDARAELSTQSFDLVILDGWRSVALQESLFWHYLKVYTVPKFGLEGRFKHTDGASTVKAAFELLDTEARERLREANRTYVSWPSSNRACPSPHATGGAVDVWLFQGGEPADLGVPFDWMEKEAGAFFHLKRMRSRFGLDGRDELVCTNRNTLIRAMVHAGFSCYGPEI